MLIQNEFVSFRTNNIGVVWCLYCWLWTYFTPCSSFSIINFEQVNAGWETSLATQTAHYIKSAIDLFNPIQMGLFGTANGWREGKNLSHISCYNETWPSYTLPNEDPKNMWTTWLTTWFLLTSVFFHRKSANFAISRYTDIDCILIHSFLLF